MCTYTSLITDKYKKIHLNRSISFHCCWQLLQGHCFTYSSAPLLYMTLQIMYKKSHRTLISLTKNSKPTGCKARNSDHRHSWCNLIMASHYEITLQFFETESSVSAGPGSAFIILLSCLGLFWPMCFVSLLLIQGWLNRLHTATQKPHLMTHIWTWLSNNVNSPWFCKRAWGLSRAVWFRRNSRFFFARLLVLVLVCACQLNLNWLKSKDWIFYMGWRVSEWDQWPGKRIVFIYNDSGTANMMQGSNASILKYNFCWDYSCWETVFISSSVNGRFMWLCDIHTMTFLGSSTF